MPTCLIPGGVLSLTADAADRLLAAGSGDGALLYLALLRYDALPAARKALRWGAPRIEAAYGSLVSASLAAPGASSDLSPTPPEPEHPPDYMMADIAQAIELDVGFAGMEREVERLLGKVLSSADLKTLYEIYDYLALPGDVILLLVNFCLRETHRKYGVGQKPRMSVLKKTAYQWRRMGLDTPEAVEDFLRGEQQLQGRERELIPLLGLSGRPLLDRERDYIALWVDMGFPDESIRMAYERTVLKKQSLHWAYMNSILKNWHAKGLHSPKEISSGDGSPLRHGGKTATVAETNQQLQRDLDDLFRE